MEVPRKIETRATLWSINLTTGFLFKGDKIRVLKRHLHSHVNCGIIHSRDDEAI